MGPEKTLESREQVEEMLALVSPDDARVLSLTILHDLDAKHVAGHLGISLGATRVRLHRALRRLRLAWTQSEASGRDERR
jgi:DNA-directed RNA polymerase specialized sigma24 family protein